MRSNHGTIKEAFYLEILFLKFTLCTKKLFFYFAD